MPEVIIDILGPTHLATAEALCSTMLERGVSPAQLLDAIREYNARAVAAMAAQAAAEAPPEPAPPPGLSCPRCGAVLELQPLCPRVSPHWRTAVACSSESCEYHGLSVHNLPYLLQHGIDDNVEER